MAATICLVKIGDPSKAQCRVIAHIFVASDGSCGSGHAWMIKLA